MTRSHPHDAGPRLRAVGALCTLLLAAGACVAGPRAEARLAPPAARLTDAAIARDLAHLDSLAGAHAHAAAGGGRAALDGRRAAMYVALARDAYERNDASGLADRLVAAGARLSRTAPLPEPALRPRRAALWSVLDSLLRAPDAAERAGELLPFERALLRAQFDVLGAPDCARWEAEAARLATGLRAAAATPSAPPAAPAAAPAAPPRQVDVPAPAPPVRAAAPDTMRGVPGGVHFALDRSTLAPASRRILDALATALERHPEVRVVLQGNTDPRGGRAYNLALSQRRADAVRAYLTSRGVSPARLAIEAQGSARPVAQGTTVLDHARNRRVSIRYVTADGREIPVGDQLDDLQVEGGGRR